MIARRSFPGGTYCDAHPRGPRAVLMWNGVETHLGVIPYEAETRPLFIRLYPEPFQFAGQASNRFGTMRWRDGWALDPRIATGDSGCIFDAAGELHVLEPAPGQTSQGYRYVAEDGRLVRADETYGPAFGLNQWSEYRGLRIGQGHDGGGVQVYDVLPGGPLRVLDTGDCKAIRVQGEGELVAVSYWKADEGAVLVTATLSDLRALPVLRSVPPVSTPPPEARVLKPEVTVDTFTLGPSAQLPDGDVAVFHDRINAIGTKVRVWVEHGSCRMSIEYAGGLKGETGARRPVR
jgi:hypothetical protein